MLCLRKKVESKIWTVFDCRAKKCHWRFPAKSAERIALLKMIWTNTWKNIDKVKISAAISATSRQSNWKKSSNIGEFFDNLIPDPVHLHSPSKTKILLPAECIRGRNHICVPTAATDPRGEITWGLMFAACTKKTTCTLILSILREDPADKVGRPNSISSVHWSRFPAAKRL